jgi:putative transposase
MRCVPGSYPYADRNTAEVRGIHRGRIHHAIAIARRYLGKRNNFTGQNFWAGGYFVSTIGRDEDVIKRYIREQEAKDKRLDQLEMFKDS